jgi:hypothetical protein
LLPGHGLLQAPQCASSVCVSEHVPTTHSVRPGLQRQLLETQLRSAGHALLHMPQWSESLAVLTHRVPLHSVKPGLHLHIPVWQYFGLAQSGAPHAPQFALSVCRFAQYVPQSVVPGAVQTQLPLMHVSSASQTFPQAPQFVLLLVVSTQKPSQSVRPASQRQSPPVQVEYDGHPAWSAALHAPPRSARHESPSQRPLQH